MKKGRVSTGRKQAKMRVIGEERSARVRVGEVVVDAYRSLLDLSVQTGMLVMKHMLEEDVEQICGCRYRHQEGRKASRWGETDGEVALGGRRVKIQRPRVRRANGGGEERLPTYEFFNSDEPVRQRVLEQVLAGVSGRGYQGSLEVEADGRSTSSSAVSRRFVALTKARMADWMSRPLHEVALCVLMIDGIEMGDHTVVVALGIDRGGEKQILGAWEGSTENASLCKDLLSDLVSRGLCVDDGVLAVIDGAKALRKAVRDVFGDKVVVHRCQQHKIRNVVDKLPKNKKAWIELKMRRAYNANDVDKAHGILKALVRELEHDHPGAASSLREGLDETLTVVALELPDTLRTSLQTTNVIESTLSIVRTVSRNVKRWRNGSMALRWTVTGLMEAERRFRRIRGYRSLETLVNVLKRKTGLDLKKEVA